VRCIRFREDCLYFYLAYPKADADDRQLLVDKRLPKADDRHH